jgi:hypothetical protein
MLHSQPSLLHTEKPLNVTGTPNPPGLSPVAAMGPVEATHTKPKLPIGFTQPFYHADAQPCEANLHWHGSQPFQRHRGLGDLDDVRTYGYKASRAAALIYAHFKKEFSFPAKR